MMHQSNLIDNFLEKRDENILNIIKSISDNAEESVSPKNTLTVVISSSTSTEAPTMDLSNKPKIHRNYSPFPTLNSNKVASSSSHILPPPSVPPPVPPPAPPIRSPYTKLSSNPPPNVAIQSSNVSTAASSLHNVDTESVTDLNPTQTSQLSDVKRPHELSMPDHSNTTFFDSDLQAADYFGNDGSTSERSADLESTAATTETSIHTTATTTTTNSLNNQSSKSENLVITLKKSVNGLGFSLTSRQNAVDLTNPVYVSKVLDKGPAILDGRMKAGDRIIMINDEDVRNLSQKEIKDILLNFAVESSVKIGLQRPSTDAISHMLEISSNTLIHQKKSTVPVSSNDTANDINNDHTQILTEEKKPPKFTMCDCVYNHSLVASEFDMYHFIITQKPAKPDLLSPLFIDTQPKYGEIKAEPPAIQLHHQNKLSPSTILSKPSTDNRLSHATLGISVRKGFSQLFFDDYESVCQSQSVASSSSAKINQDELYHKLCPNCHGLLFLKNGVFVTAIIPGEAAYMDGRLANGDEIIAVQSICLSDGEQFVFPNNKVPLGDPYQSSTISQMSSISQNRISTIDRKKPDPLNLLKQLLNQAQSTGTSVSLVILRRGLEKRFLPNNTTSSTDSNYGHNVTVAADVHTQYGKENVKGELFNFVVPNFVHSNYPTITPSIKERIERFEDLSVKVNKLRFFGKEDDDLPKQNISTDLICLDSEHEFDENVDKTPIPSSSKDNENNSELRSTIPEKIAQFEEEYVHCVKMRSNNNNSDFDDAMYSVDISNNSSPYLSHPFETTDRDGGSVLTINDSDFLHPEYFSREDNTRQSFSLKRIHLNAPSSSARMSRFAIFKTEEKNPKIKIRNHCDLKRPKSEVILSRVEEESDNYELGEQTDIEELNKNTPKRRVTLRRRAVITRKQSRMSAL